MGMSSGFEVNDEIKGDVIHNQMTLQRRWSIFSGDEE